LTINQVNLTQRNRTNNELTRTKTTTHIIISAAPYFIIAAAIVVYFWEIIINKNFIGKDLIQQYYPFHFFLFKKLRAFTLPIWNPYMYAGIPFLADIQTQVFYPLNWLLALIASPNQNYVFWLIEIKCLLHLLLAGIGFYLLMRELKLSPFAGIISGLTYSFSSFMVLHLMHLTMISTFAWFPLILLFFYRTLIQHRIKDALGTGVTLGFANLAGHPQMILYIVCSTGFLFILFVIFNWEDTRPHLFRKQLPLLGISLLIGFALAACALLPAYRFSLHTIREQMSYIESAEISLSPWFFITVLIPKFFGSVTCVGTECGTDTVFFWQNSGNYFYWETALYIGIIPLVLAISGLVHHHHNLRWQFTILALVALLLALGKYTPVYRWAFELLPGFKLFRVPARFTAVFTVCFAFLAGLGMDHFIKEKSPTIRLLLPALAVLGYGCLLFGLLISRILNNHLLPLKSTVIMNNALVQSATFFGLAIIATGITWLRIKFRRLTLVFASLLLLVTFVDFYHFGHKFNLGNLRPDQLFKHRPAIQLFRTEAQKSHFRINARLGDLLILERNEGLIWQLELLEGFTPLQLNNYATFDIPITRRNDLLNVKYEPFIDIFTQAYGFVDNPIALPRTWLSDTCVVISDRKEILKILAKPDFDYRRVVILEKKPLPAPEFNPVPESIGKITITQHLAEKIVLEVENPRPAILMLSEIFYPDWKAKVNSKPVEILCADYCLRAIPLPAGNHKVVIYYDRLWINIGIIISLLTVMLTILTLLTIKSRKLNAEVNDRHNTR